MQTTLRAPIDLSAIKPRNQYRVTATNDRCTVTLFTFHDGHLGIAGAKRLLRDLQRSRAPYRFEIVTEPEGA